MDGYIEAKSLDTDAGGGGSGGSIYIRAKIFTGGHTGALRVTGGGSQGSGGGGAGGRIAVYYTNNATVPFYAGVFETYGGGSLSGGTPGASGTTYLEHVTNKYSSLRVDNRGRKPIRNIIRNEGRRISTSGGSYSSTTYTTPSGITVLISAPYYAPWYSRYHFPLSRLFDGNLNTRFITLSKRPTLTIDLKRTVFVNHVRIYPACSSGPAKFKVRSHMTIILILRISSN